MGVVECVGGKGGKSQGGGGRGVLGEGQLLEVQVDNCSCLCLDQTPSPRPAHFRTKAGLNPGHWEPFKRDMV